MILKTRIIPCLLLKGHSLVKSIKFDNFRTVGNSIQSARLFNAQRVDELVVLDINASRQNYPPNYKVMAHIAEECYMPICLGGGIRTLEHIGQLLRVGADKVMINSGGYDDPDFISKAAEEFGSQCIVAGIECKSNDKGSYTVFTHGGSVSTGLGPVEWANKIVNLGAGEIFLYSIDKDGTMEGYDLDLISTVTRNVDVPVIACGGVGSHDHLVEGVMEGGASAVAASSIFYFTEISPISAKEYMKKSGINVRI